MSWWPTRASMDQARALRVLAERERARLAPTCEELAWRKFQADLAARPRESVLMGTDAEHGELRAGIGDFGSHLLCLGATGCGKSYALATLATEVFARRLGGLVVVDPKGETVDLFRDRLLPALAHRLGSHDALRLADQVRILDPFDGARLPPLNVLVRDPSIEEAVQVHDIVDSFLSAAGAATGARIDTILTWLLRLCLGRASLLTVHRALGNEHVLRELVRTSTDRDVKEYFTERWKAEPSMSKQALAARLDRFLALQATRRSVSASSCFDMRAALDGGVTLINLGNAPAGSSSIARFFGSLLFGRLVRAIYQRPASGGRAPATVWIDEWHSLLTSSIATSVEDILARARSRRVGLWLSNQQLVQIDRVIPGLSEVVLGQTAMKLVFRVPREDARKVRDILPVTGRRIRRGRPDEMMTNEEEFEAVVSDTVNLPARSAWFSNRAAPDARARLVRTVDVPAVPAIDRALGHKLRSGTGGVPVGELDALIDAEAQKWNRRAPSSWTSIPGGAPRQLAVRGKRRRPGVTGIPW